MSTLSESCSCGATLTYSPPAHVGTTSLSNMLADWRKGHRHEPRPLPTPPPPRKRIPLAGRRP